MKNLELSFASADDGAFDVRSFVVREGLSSLFSVSLSVVSPLDAIELGDMIGQRADFRIHGGALGRSGLQKDGSSEDDGDHERGRAWTGIVKRFEQVHAEPTGLSTYELEIVPSLWLLTQRSNYRVFTRVSAVDLVRKLLADWDIKPILKISGEHPKLESRIQYGESDFELFSRTLEGAGITYRFTHDAEDGETKLELNDAPEQVEPRPGGAMRFVDSPAEDARAEFVTNIRVGQRIRPGAVVVRDHDFRRRSEVDLSGRGDAKGLPIEQKLEVYRFRPGAFLVAKDGAGGASHEPKLAGPLAEKRLRAARHGNLTVSFDTNAFDLAPGTTTSIARHPHPELKGRVLVTSLTLSGSPEGEWNASGTAVFTKEPYHPPRATKQPKVTGVQSGIVVGPPGDDIHCDEYGRVKVRFPWDRGEQGDDAGCWVRVSQGWAGAGFGMMNIPRVGQEVLVAFIDGNPDLPVVVGRAFNATARHPYSLPAEKTLSYWRTSSTPGGEGYSELVFEDKKGSEYVRLRAEKDLHKLVRHDEVENTGANKTVSIGRNRAVTVAGADSTIVGERQEIVVKDPDGVKPPTTITMEDGKITYSTGKASLTLDGSDISLDAEGSITIRSKTGDVIIQGGPNVKINCD
jgi:type VI secretion system secreted protein VgrG